MFVSFQFCFLLFCLEDFLCFIWCLLFGSCLWFVCLSFVWFVCVFTGLFVDLRDCVCLLVQWFKFAFCHCSRSLKVEFVFRAVVYFLLEFCFCWIYVLGCFPSFREPKLWYDVIFIFFRLSLVGGCLFHIHWLLYNWVLVLLWPGSYRSSVFCLDFSGFWRLLSCCFCGLSPLVGDFLGIDFRLFCSMKKGSDAFASFVCFFFCFGRAILVYFGCWATFLMVVEWFWLCWYPWSWRRFSGLLVEHDSKLDEQKNIKTKTKISEIYIYIHIYSFSFFFISFVCVCYKPLRPRQSSCWCGGGSHAAACGLPVDHMAVGFLTNQVGFVWWPPASGLSNCFGRSLGFGPPAILILSDWDVGCCYDSCCFIFSMHFVRFSGLAVNFGAR